MTLHKRLASIWLVSLVAVGAYFYTEPVVQIAAILLAVALGLLFTGAAIAALLD